MEPTPRECQHCGAPFIAVYSVSRYCSVNCRKSAYYARKNPPAELRCVRCTHLGCNISVFAKLPRKAAAR